MEHGLTLQELFEIFPEGKEIWLRNREELLKPAPPFNEKEWIKSLDYMVLDAMVKHIPRIKQLYKEILQEGLEMEQAKLAQEEEELKNLISSYNDMSFEERRGWEIICEPGYIARIEESNKKIRWIQWKLKSLKRGYKPPAGRITPDDVLAVKQIPLQNFYDGGKLRKVGGKLWGNCPFHSEKSASFAIYLNQNSFACYGCNTSGDVIEFIKKKQNLTFIEAVKFLLNK